MINKKIDSVRALRNSVLGLINSNELAKALRQIHDFVERIVTEPLCSSHVFGSKPLDALCMRIGQITYTHITSRLTESSINLANPEEPVFVYIATKVQKSGGHTRVIDNFIKAQQGGRHVILLTGLEGQSDIDFFQDTQNNQLGCKVEQSPKVDYQQRLIWLQTRLMQLNPKKVFLFNHHQDSVAVAAIQPEMKLDAYFYHHGDHHLCLGVYLSHLNHIDPHPMGYHHCRDKLGINNSYIPLTAEDKGGRPVDMPFLRSGKLTTCTAGRSNKIEIPYFASYVDLVPKIIKATGGRHIHIGNLSVWALYRIRQGLKFHGIESDRFLYIKWVPSVWKALHDNQVDLYIASFPYGGGITLIEAMGAGIPVALHRHIFSEIVSCIGLAYQDAFSWRYPEELVRFCESVSLDELKESSAKARLQFERFYDIGHLRDFLSQGAGNDLVPERAGSQFVIEADEWGSWMERQLSLRRLFSRSFYRLVRYLRAYFS